MVHRTLPGFILAALVSAGLVFGQNISETSKAVVNETALLSYEGQLVSVVELAGRPDLNTEQLQQLIPIHSGERLSPAKILEAVDVLRSTYQFKDVQVELMPEFDGIRVTF